MQHEPFNQGGKCGAVKVAISWPPEFTASCYYEIATAQIKCSTRLLYTSEYKQRCSASARQWAFKGWRTPFAFSSTDFTSNFACISDYTTEFAVNGVLYGFFDLDISCQQIRKLSCRLKNLYLRPKILNSIELGDKTKICLPSFALVIFKKPECPSKGEQNKNIQKLKYIKNVIISIVIFKLISNLNILWAWKFSFHQ